MPDIGRPRLLLAKPGPATRTDPARIRSPLRQPEQYPALGAAGSQVPGAHGAKPYSVGVAGGSGGHRRLSRSVGLVLAVMLCVWSAYFFIAQTRTWPVAFLDSSIYREAAKAFLAGSDVYSGKFGPPGLPFT